MEFETAFKESKGQPINYKGQEVIMVDKVDIPPRVTNLTFRFLECNSTWRQGAVLQTKGKFFLNGQSFLSRIVLWQDTAPAEISISLDSKDKLMLVYNVWDMGDGTMHYWHNGAAIKLEKHQSKRIYYCNDGVPDDDFNELIFEIEF